MNVYIQPLIPRETVAQYLIILSKIQKARFSVQSHSTVVSRLSIKGRGSQTPVLEIRTKAKLDYVYCQG